MTDLPKTAVTDAYAAYQKAWLTRNQNNPLFAENVVRDVLEAAAPSLAVTENLARLGVDPSEWDMYANALGYDMTPEQVLAAVRGCTTRDELDKLTEGG